MIARAAVMGLVLVAAALIETSVLPFLPVTGLTPNLLLLITVMVALTDGPQAGLRVGFSAGLLSDLMAAQLPVGAAVLVMTSVGGLVGTARPYISSQSLTAPLLVAFLTGVAATGAYGLTSLLLGQDRVTWDIIATASLRVGLFNTLLAPLLLMGAVHLSDRFPLGTSGAE